MKPDQKTHNLTKAKLFLLIQSLLCILLCMLLVLAALDIYREGAANKAEHPLDTIYTREKIETRLRPVAPLFLLSITMTAVGLILNIQDSNLDKPVRDVKYARDLIVSRIAEPDEAMKKERTKQRRLLMIGCLVFTACMAPVLVYLCSEAHFPEGDLERMIRGLAAVLIPWTALGFGGLTVCSVLQERSIRREFEAAQARLKEESLAGSNVERKPKAEKANRKLGLVRTILLLAALVFILVGVWNGGARDVLYKAVKICTECVGLG